MIRRSQGIGTGVVGRVGEVGGRGGQDPEISQISLSTNFLRGRTSRIRPPGPQKSGPDPRIPEKSGPDPRFPGFRGLDPRKPGIPAEMDQISRKRPFSRVPGGVGKSRKQPHDTRTVPENDRLQLMPPPWDLCLFAPDPPSRVSDCNAPPKSSAPNKTQTGSYWRSTFI